MTHGVHERQDCINGFTVKDDEYNECCWFVLAGEKKRIVKNKAYEERTNEPFMQITDSVFYVHFFFVIISFDVYANERENLLMLGTQTKQQQ